MEGHPLCAGPSIWKLSLISLQPGEVVLHLDPIRIAAACPSCGVLSLRVHSLYQRNPHDLPWASWSVRLVIHTRRFFCDNSDCTQRIFTERFSGILEPYARQTERLRAVLLELAHSSNAEMAARMAGLIGMPTSPDTLIRRQRQEHFDSFTPTSMGVDEFSFRRGVTFGTIVVDLDDHKPVDVLDGHTTKTLADWLSDHQGIKVLTRDRSEAYASAARSAAPDAMQVADRFHLIRNVSHALRDLIRSRRWKEPETPGPEPLPPEQPTATPPEPEPTPLKRARWQAVHELRNQGISILGISRTLGMSRGTIRRYLTLDQPPIFPRRPPRPKKITPYLDYLHKRWTEGCHSARQLYQELLQLGFQGSERRVAAAVRPWRAISGPPPPPKPVTPLRCLLLCPQSKLTDFEMDRLQRVLEANPALAMGHRLKEWFHKIVSERDADSLDSWIQGAATSDLPTFKTLSKTFRHDYEAIRAALTTKWSNAQCEGQITRVKLIKRLGYGRAKLDLLRARVLHRMAAA